MSPTPSTNLPGDLIDLFDEVIGSYELLANGVAEAPSKTQLEVLTAKYATVGGGARWGSVTSIVHLADKARELSDRLAELDLITKDLRGVLFRAADAPKYLNLQAEMSSFSLSVSPEGLALLRATRQFLPTIRLSETERRDRLATELLRLVADLDDDPLEDSSLQKFVKDALLDLIGALYGRSTKGVEVAAQALALAEQVAPTSAKPRLRRLAAAAFYVLTLVSDASQVLQMMPDQFKPDFLSIESQVCGPTELPAAPVLPELTSGQDLG